MVYLWEQNRGDDDGLEHSIRENIEKSEIIWFPNNRALCLDVDDENIPEQRRKELKNILATWEESFMNKLAQLRAGVTTIVQRSNKLCQLSSKCNRQKTSLVAPLNGRDNSGSNSSNKGAYVK